MPKAKKRRRSILAPILALLLVLALAGTLLFSAFRDKIEHWEYPTARLMPCAKSCDPF